MSPQAIMNTINGGMSMLQGFMDYRAAKKVANIQRKMADKQFEFNRQQMIKAYTNNYGKMMMEYASAINSLDNQFQQGKTAINMMLQQQGGAGIDIDGSSLRNDMENRLKDEMQQSINKLTAESIIKNRDAYQNFIGEELGIGIQHSNTIFGVTANKIQQQSQAMSRFIQGAMEIGQAIMNDRMAKGKAEGEQSSTNGDGGVGSFINKVRQGSDYYNHQMVGREMRKPYNVDSTFRIKNGGGING